MNNAVRAWVLLVVTLCLGIALGLLGGGALRDRRMARVNDLRRPGGFVEHVREVIRPTSDSQWLALRPFVEATSDHNAGLRRTQDSAMRASLDSLRARLDPMLSADQRERLSRFVPGRPGGLPGGPPRGPGRGRESPPPPGPMGEPPPGPPPP
jgi:hypothetical protein